MTKNEAIRIIVSCAKDYHKYLENYNLLFLFSSQNTPQYFEAAFFPRNFLHLTGAVLAESNCSGSSDFYKKALKGALGAEDFSLARNGTTELKLRILPQLMRIHRSAKMVGDYNSTKSTLYTEKLVGNVSACLGFVCEGKYYIPNTALKEDIRDISIKPQFRILSVLRKPIAQETYKELCYLAKNVSLQDITLPKELISIVALEDIQKSKLKPMQPSLSAQQSEQRRMVDRFKVAKEEATRRNRKANTTALAQGKNEQEI